MAEHQQIGHLGIALALGLLIGIERGWHERAAHEGARVAGVRTFGLIGLLGGVMGLAATRMGVALIGLSFVGLVIALTAAYLTELKRDADLGITSLVAGLLTFGFGTLAVLGFSAAAAAAAVITALLLGVKPQLHRWVEALEPEELRAAVKLLLISVVLLPMLPNRGYGPWQVLNPYEIWWMVVLIAGISFTGYFAIKIAGERIGIAVTGLAGGLVSSTALTLHFARLRRTRPELTTLLASGILLACGTMFPRMLLISSLINPRLFPVILPPMVAMALPVYVPALAYWCFRGQQPGATQARVVQNPLELGTALRFGALLALILLLAASLQHFAGHLGVLLLAGVSGIADVDAITLSLSRMSTGNLSTAVVVAGVVIASAVNNGVKGLLAAVVGGVALGLRVGLPLLVALMAGLGTVWMMSSL